MEPIRLNKESVSLDKLVQICEQEFGGAISFHKIFVQNLAKIDELPKNLCFGELMSKEEYTKQLLEEPHLMYKGEADASSGRTLIWFPDCEEPFTLEELDNIEAEAYREIAEFLEEPLEEMKNLSSFYRDNMQPVYTKPQGTSSYFRDHLHVQRMMRRTTPYKTGVPMELLDELEKELEVKKRHENNQNPQGNP